MVEAMRVRDPFSMNSSRLCCCFLLKYWISSKMCIRDRADAAPQQGGKEHPPDLDRGGTEMSNKHRVFAAVLVIILVISMLASLIIPYLSLL